MNDVSTKSLLAKTEIPLVLLKIGDIRGLHAVIDILKGDNKNLAELSIMGIIRETDGLERGSGIPLSQIEQAFEDPADFVNSAKV